MKNNEFKNILEKAIKGDVLAKSQILILYEPLIKKFSYIYGKFDEDLYQELMGAIFNNIHKFKI